MTIEILPDEILSHIWSLVDEDKSGPEVPYILAAVSQRWRSIALDTSHLWAKIFVGQERGGLSDETKIRLDRSKEAPLTIRFIRTSPEVLKELGERMDSWQNLFIAVEAYKVVFKYISERVAASSEDVLPRLTEVTIALTHGAENVDKLKSTGKIFWPNLRTLNFTYNSLRGWFHIFPASLTRVSIIVIKMDGHDFSLLAEKCPNLVEIHLAVSRFEKLPGDFTSPPLRHLKEITVGENCPILLLQAISSKSPNFTSLVWRPRPSGSSFEPSKKTRPMNITRLTLDFVVRGAIRQGPSNIDSVMVICPSLSTLSVRSARPTKRYKKGSDLQELQEKKIEGVKEILKEVFGTLTDETTRHAHPALSVIELQNVPLENDQAMLLARRLEGRTSCLKISGCNEISEDDCREMRKFVDVEYINLRKQGS